MGFKTGKKYYNKITYKNKFETLKKYSFLFRENKLKPNSIIDLRISKKIIITNDR